VSVTSLPIAAVTQQLSDACGQDPGLLCRRVFESTHDSTLAASADFVVGKPLTILAIVLAAALVNRLARRAIKRGLRRLASGGLRERFGAARKRRPGGSLLDADTGEISVRSTQRVEALATVLRSVASFAIWTIAIFMILGEFGINLGPLIAGAGIIGVALGFGSQSLVRAFLSGIFILVEDQYGVGDTVDLGEATGVVEVVSLRTTRVRSVDGTVWHVPNGAIARVGNKSQHWSRALLDVQVAYGTDISHAREVIKRVADDVHQERSGWVLEEPELWGVEELGPHGIAIRLVIKTQPSRQWDVSRLVRERLKEAFDEEGIEIPFPQQMVWHRRGEDGPDAPADRRVQPSVTS
jgi:moderate conductance mechanosensitive channel